MSGADTGKAKARRSANNSGAADSVEQDERPAQTPQTADLLPANTSAAPLILIAEDEEPIAEALAYIIEDAGYRSLRATDGKEALDLARTRHPALVITDLMMPYMDGAALIAALRADAASDGHKPTPIILMTAAGLRRAEQAGADALLRKPFNLNDLEALLHRFLRPQP